MNKRKASSADTDMKVRYMVYILSEPCPSSPKFRKEIDQLFPHVMEKMVANADGAHGVKRPGKDATDGPWRFRP